MVAITSPRVALGRTLLSLTTKPALWFFTLRTISAREAIGCDAQMKASPPQRASAIAMRSSATDCIIAAVTGTWMHSADVLPVLKRVMGARRSTDSGTVPLRVRFGISRYSPKIRLGSG